MATAASAPGTAASLHSVATAATSFQFGGGDLERVWRKPRNLLFCHSQFWLPVIMPSFLLAEMGFRLCVPLAEALLTAHRSCQFSRPDRTPERAAVHSSSRIKFPGFPVRIPNPEILRGYDSARSSSRLLRSVPFASHRPRQRERTRTIASSSSQPPWIRRRSHTRSLPTCSLASPRCPR
jgi:hypothetical protein